MNFTKITPISTRVLISKEIEKTEEKTKSGLYIPATSESKKIENFIIGKLEKGGDDISIDALSNAIKENKSVVFEKHGIRSQFESDNKILYIVDESDIFAILE